jgi:hypothetical protein
VFERPRPRETEGPPDLTALTRLFDIEDQSARTQRQVPRSLAGTLEGEITRVERVRTYWAPLLPAPSAPRTRDFPPPPMRRNGADCEMSTGSALSGMEISLMATFFREFPYEKNGVEYLVKRRFLTGIDVINGNPDNHIGFSDMLERAKRVTGDRTN